MRGISPFKCMVVGGFFRLLPFLDAWAPDFQDEWWLLVLLAV